VTGQANLPLVIIDQSPFIQFHAKNKRNMGLLYSFGPWGSFFVAVATAGSALCGLVFVGLSLKLERIKQSPALVGRGGEALALLLFTLIFSLICLVPSISPRIAGVLILVCGLFLWLFVTNLHRTAYHEQKETLLAYLTIRITIAQVATIPIIVSGISLIFKAGGGLAWLAFGLAMCVVVAVFDAWVLTIEIVR
jgi:hypothetical protein